MRCLAAGLCAVLMVSACGGGEDGRSTGPAGAEAAPTIPRGGTESPEDQPMGPISGGGAADHEAAGDAPRISVSLSQRCESPAGFRIAYPGGWAVNSGETVPACTRFAPDPFRVPAGTDARVGAVTAWVRSSSFDRIADSPLPPVASRTHLSVDGRKAARIERVSVGQGLYPAGTRITSYVVELEPGPDGPRALVVDTVGLPQSDYARNTQVLDRMMETIVLTEG